MNLPLFPPYPGQVRAGAELADAVAGRDGCVSVTSVTGVGMGALLDQVERELSQYRIRCVRVHGPASGGIAVRDLIAQVIGAQVIGRPDPGALTDSDLKAGFVALTEPGLGNDCVALLVAEAHSLLPSALRYIQLACCSSPAKLRVVLAGRPNLATVMADGEFAQLRSVTRELELTDGGFAVAGPPAVPEGRSLSSSLARLGMAALIVPIVGLIWWRHLPATPVVPTPSATPAAVPAKPAPIRPPPFVQPIETEQERAEEITPSEPEQDVAAAALTPPQTAEAPVAALGPVEPAFASVASGSVATASVAASEPPPAEATPPPDAAPSVEAKPSVEATPPVATTLQRTEAPAQDTDLAAAATPEPTAPLDAAPPQHEPVIEPGPLVRPAPPSLGTLTVKAAVPNALPPPPHLHEAMPRGAATAAAASASRAMDERPRPTDDRTRPAEARLSDIRASEIRAADDRRCRDIVLKAQLGQGPSDADKQFLRGDCRTN